MAQVIVTESSLQNIAGAIRSKLGTQDTYTPSEMAGAISQIHGDPVLEALSVNANGTYTPSSGKDGFSQAVVNVPNSYSSGDEGKVVSGGALVAQSSQSITENGTYDTTLKNQVTVNVSGGGSVLVPKTITQNGTYNPASDNADGYSQVVVNVSGGSNYLEEWDFTQSLVGKIRGFTPTVSGAVQDSNGVTFDSTSDYLMFGNYALWRGIIIELDIGAMSLTSDAHRRFIMFDPSQGLIYRNTGRWSFYSNGSWTDSTETDGAFFANSTIKIYIDDNKRWHIYKNNVLWWEPSIAAYMDNKYSLYVGSSSGQSINNAVITGMRIY